MDPRIRERRIIRGRKAFVTPALFPGYVFVLVELQWHAIRRTPYVIKLIMNGERPARVPDHARRVAPAEAKRADRLPAPPPAYVLARACGSRAGLSAGTLSLLGAQQRVTLPRATWSQFREGEDRLLSSQPAPLARHYE